MLPRWESRLVFRAIRRMMLARSSARGNVSGPSRRLVFVVSQLHEGSNADARLARGKGSPSWEEKCTDSRCDQVGRRDAVPSTNALVPQAAQSHNRIARLTAQPRHRAV